MIFGRSAGEGWRKLRYLERDQSLFARGARRGRAHRHAGIRLAQLCRRWPGTVLSSEDCVRYLMRHPLNHSNRFAYSQFQRKISYAFQQASASLPAHAPTSSRPFADFTSSPKIIPGDISLHRQIPDSCLLFAPSSQLRETLQNLRVVPAVSVSQHVQGMPVGISLRF